MVTLAKRPRRAFFLLWNIDPQGRKTWHRLDARSEGAREGKPKPGGPQEVQAVSYLAGITSVLPKCSSGMFSEGREGWWGVAVCFYLEAK